MVERTWIGTGGYRRFRGEWVKELLKISTDVSPVMILESPRGVTAIIIWAIWVCAAVKGMVFKQFTLGYGI